MPLATELEEDVTSAELDAACLHAETIQSRILIPTANDTAAATTAATSTAAGDTSAANTAAAANTAVADTAATNTAGPNTAANAEGQEGAEGEEEEVARGDRQENEAEEEEGAGKEEETGEEEEEEEEEEGSYVAEEEEREEEGEEEADEEEEKGEEGEAGEDGSRFYCNLEPELQAQIRRHICKAGAGGFSADAREIMLPLPWPTPSKDGSFVYLIFAGRLVPRIRTSSRKAADTRSDIVTGKSMGTIGNMRFRLVAPVLLYATTSTARTEFQAVVCGLPFSTWLVVLEHPSLPCLVVAPAHHLESVAAATEDELDFYGSAEGTHSRGTSFMQSLIDGAPGQPTTILYY
jgi:hypothetical protein